MPAQGAFHGDGVEHADQGGGRAQILHCLAARLGAGHASDRVPLADQLGDQRPADHTGRPGYEDFHGCRPLNPSSVPG